MADSVYITWQLQLSIRGIFFQILMSLKSHSPIFKTFRTPRLQQKIVTKDHVTVSQCCLRIARPFLCFLVLCLNLQSWFVSYLFWTPFCDGAGWVPDLSLCACCSRTYLRVFTGWTRGRRHTQGVEEPMQGFFSLPLLDLIKLSFQGLHVLFCHPGCLITFACFIY